MQSYGQREVITAFCLLVGQSDGEYGVGCWKWPSGEVSWSLVQHRVPCQTFPARDKRTIYYLAYKWLKFCQISSTLGLVAILSVVCQKTVSQQNEFCVLGGWKIREGWTCVVCRSWSRRRRLLVFWRWGLRWGPALGRLVPQSWVTASCGRCISCLFSYWTFPYVVALKYRTGHCLYFIGNWQINRPQGHPGLTRSWLPHCEEDMVIFFILGQKCPLFTRPGPHECLHYICWWLAVLWVVLFIIFIFRSSPALLKCLFLLLNIFINNEVRTFWSSNHTLLELENPEMVVCFMSLLTVSCDNWEESQEKPAVIVYY